VKISLDIAKITPNMWIRVEKKKKRLIREK
jgi:hypothetical protein